METPPKRLLESDHFFCFRLYAASRAFAALYRPLLEPLGLTSPQCLVMVGEKDCPNVKQLAKSRSRTAAP